MQRNSLHMRDELGTKPTDEAMAEEISALRARLDSLEKRLDATVA